MDALTRSMNVPTVNLGMALGLPAVSRGPGLNWAYRKISCIAVPAMLLGALNLTPIEVAQAFQTIASGGNRAPLSALRSVIAEDVHGAVSELSAGRTRCSGAGGIS
ncbi:hypothetical protein MJ524_05470 [Escherichia coli]|nr:hypothetical protein MJ524_05470 [Escherichia coli]